MTATPEGREGEGEPFARVVRHNFQDNLYVGEISVTMRASKDNAILENRAKDINLAHAAAVKKAVDEAVAEQKEKYARIAENEQEPDITATPPEAIEAMKRNPALVVLAAVRVTKKNIAAAIRSAK